ncbi:hypothetical protein DNTS_023795 [Danionella cerebrum]|uniref:Chloride channel protein n=1 Tax=Danionella cerebrum TaxID=2873325 RepID=A0A553QR44_9TELE|nr:hypothetical protein DNTS_023795 [Danionella translucida]
MAVETKDADENYLEQGVYKKQTGPHRWEGCRRTSLSDLSSSKKCGAWLSHLQRLFASFIGADWIFLMILGFVMAVISFVMDIFVFLFTDGHRWIYFLADYHVLLQYVAWILYSMILMCFAAGFANIVSPQAVGSGIPEMKTALRGVVLYEYLTFRTLVSKIISLICVLGSELPVGKEGPFVHIGGMCAALLCKFMALFSNIYKNEARNKEMLTVGCAVGIGCCFASPIGGVLFSLEVTSMFYVARNYWRAFVSATFGALVFRLLPVWHHEEETIVALYPTKYEMNFPFDLRELPVFAAMGIVCGLGGALFVYIYGKITLFVKRQKASKSFLMRNPFLYSALTSVLISTLTFPPGFGQFMAGKLTQRDSLISFFDTRTWSNNSIVLDFHPDDHLAAWKHPQANVFVVLTVFVVMKFWMSALSITLPIPCGSFVPIFVIGAGFGRLIGEVMATLFPEGIATDGHIYPIVPGAYAVVGAAALTAGVTHTLSTGVIMMELTGQITHSLPILVAVILANIVSQNLQPSIYDTVIKIKRLPYLPLLNWGEREKSNVQVEDFMKKDVCYLSLNASYRDLCSILSSTKHKILPLVKSEESMLLLGSVEREDLLKLLKIQSQSLRDGAHSLSARRRVSFQTSSEGSSASALLSQSKPLKSALKKDDQEELSNFYDSGTSFKKFFCAQPDIEAMEDNSNVEDDETLQEVKGWEELQLDEQVNFNACKIDPAPFQLVERTSLHKAHCMFSVVNLDFAFITSVGRLVGVFSLKELRQAIEGFMPEDGVKLRTVLPQFRERGIRGPLPQTCEIHTLLEHQD